MAIPAGTNKIEFKFEPQVIEIGSKFSLGSSFLFALILVGGLFYKLRKREIITKGS